ncbi:MAG: hypothetical protein VKJ86_08890 [Synechococcus sp.]|nr:hypothetical protein [Synechococcus sp.]
MQSIATLDLSGIRPCLITTEHPFDTDFAPAQAESDWVKLETSTGEVEYALLLCRHTEQSWVAWVPSQGEVILRQNQLCRLR